MISHQLCKVICVLLLQCVHILLEAGLGKLDLLLEEASVAQTPNSQTVSAANQANVLVWPL